MAPGNEHNDEVIRNVAGISDDLDLQALSRIWIREITPHKWAYNFNWLGRPAIQFPNDTWMIQELIWRIKPDLIIETGIAHGGSLIFSASMLAILDLCESIESKKVFTPGESTRKVVGIDVDIRKHNYIEIEKHPLSVYINMIQGSSTDASTINQVKSIAQTHHKIMVLLDSNHTENHVLAELEAYAPLVTKDSYCVVFDTIIDDMPADLSKDRPWGPGNNPKTAVKKYLQSNMDFSVDHFIQKKLLITVAPDGYLRRIRA